MSLTIKQKVTVVDRNGEPVAAGTVEELRTLDGKTGPLAAVKVREAGLNSILALAEHVRPWREGDPEPQERRYVDAPGAARRAAPSRRFPVVAAEPDPEPQDNVAPDDDDDDDTPAMPPRRRTAPAPESFDLGKVMDEMGREMGSLG